MRLGLMDGPFVPHSLISTQESPVPLPKFQMAPRLKNLNGLRIQERNPDILFLSQKSRQTALQVPQQGPYEERGPFAGHFAYLKKKTSFGFPTKGALSQGPLMESLVERYPTTRALHSSIKVPGIRDPRIPGSPRLERGPHGEMPASGDFLNIFQGPQ